MKIQWSKDPILAPTNQPRMKCEKTQSTNSFESILDECVPYSIVIENITVGETRNMEYVQICLSGICKRTLFICSMYYFRPQIRV